jgi:hypothetical protein
MPLILKDACRDERVVIARTHNLLTIQELMECLEVWAKKCGVGNGDPKSPLPTPSPRFCGR